MNMNSRVYPEGLFDKVLKLREEERKNRILKEENTRRVLIEKVNKKDDSLFFNADYYLDVMIGLPNR